MLFNERRMGDAICIRKYQIVGSGPDYAFIQYCAFPEPVLFVATMEHSAGKAGTEFGQRLTDARAGAIVAHDNFKIAACLHAERKKSAAQKVHMLIRRNKNRSLYYLS
jgi:hypothetical protein